MHYLGQLLPYLTKDENLENFETLKKYRNKIEWKRSHFFTKKKPFQKFLLDGRIPWKFTFWSKTQKCGKQKYLNFKHSTSYRMIMITCFSHVKVLKLATLLIQMLKPELVEIKVQMRLNWSVCIIRLNFITPEKKLKREKVCSWFFQGILFLRTAFWQRTTWQILWLHKTKHQCEVTFLKFFQVLSKDLTEQKL